MTMTGRIPLATTAFAAALLVAPAAMAEPASTIVIMDGSGSMWGQIDGRTKLEIARETAAQVLGAIPDGQILGLMAYGHRTRGDCSDIELVVPPGAGTAAAILEAVRTMRFQGKTPLTESVRQAAAALRSSEAPAAVVLVTDGIETCEADPCAMASELEAAGVDFTAHVIGFGLSREQGAQVACIADNTGGRYMEAGNAAALGEALVAAVTEAAPSPPAIAPSAPERRRYYPGAEIMPQAALTPTGGDTGETVPFPAEVAFPADGTIAQCRAACAADQACGAWRYEPAGSYFVEHARCFVFSTATEFDLRFYAADEDWASGMKPGVESLVRPYVAIGQTDVDAALAVTEAVPPGAEFTVVWRGPANEGDWIDLVPAGHTDIGGELAYFYVNDTIELGDAPEGAGTLTAPTEPGAYLLRYVLGREVDRRAVLTVPLTVGGPVGVPATPTAASPPPGVDAGETAPMAQLVEATFRADTGGLELGVMWSAVPVPGQDLPPEAWAMQEPVHGPITELFLPGDYDVRGDAGDSVFFGRVRITPDGPNDFLIPVSASLSPAGEDPGSLEEGYACPGPDDCLIDDPTGLSFVLPAGWTSDLPFLAETAGGAVASAPVVTFTGPDGQLLLLNPIRWIESNGTCSRTAVGDLCIFGVPDGVALTAFATIMPSLSYPP
jgi:hypothetical protein